MRHPRLRTRFVRSKQAGRMMGMIFGSRASSDTMYLEYCPRVQHAVPRIRGWLTNERRGKEHHNTR